MQNIAKRQRNQLARIRDEFVIDKFVDFAIVLYPSAADGKPLHVAENQIFSSMLALAR